MVVHLVNKGYNKENRWKGVVIVMEVAELTTKIENLSKEDYNMVIMLVNRLSEKSENCALEKMGEDELVEQLSDSIRKSNLGLTKSAKEVSRSMRDKYAI